MSFIREWNTVRMQLDSYSYNLFLNALNSMMFWTSEILLHIHFCRCAAIFLDFTSTIEFFDAFSVPLFICIYGKARTIHQCYFFLVDVNFTSNVFFDCPEKLVLLKCAQIWSGCSTFLLLLQVNASTIYISILILRRNIKYII